MSQSKVKAGQAYVELSTRDSAFQRGLANAQKRLRSFSASARMAGAQLFAGGGALLGPILASGKAFASAGDEVQKMAIRTGISAETLSTMSFAAEQSGSDLATFEKAIGRMHRQVAEAAGGNRAAVETFYELGIGIEQIKNLAPEDQFKALADQIKAIRDPAAKMTAAMRVFGKAGQALLPILNEGRAGIEGLQAEARDLGLEISGEGAEEAAKLNDSLNRLTRTLRALPLIVGRQVAPAMERTTNLVAANVASVGRWVGANREAVMWAAKLGAGLAIAGSAVLSLAVGSWALSTALGGMGSVLKVGQIALYSIGGVLTWLLTPTGLAVAAVAGLGAAILRYTSRGQAAMLWLGETFGRLKDLAVTYFGAIGRAIAAGDLEAAGRVAMAGLRLAWATGVNQITGIWAAFRDNVIDTGEGMVYGLAQIFSDGWATVETVWTETIGFLADAWGVFQNGLTSSWHKTIGFIQKAWVRLKGMFGQDIDIEAEVAAIDRRTSEKVDSGQSALSEAIAGRDAQRRSRRDEIEANRAGRADALRSAAADPDGRRAARERAAQAEVDKAAADLQVAKGEWREAIDAIGENQPNAAEPRDRTWLQDVIAKMQSEMAAGLDAGMESEKKALESKSTFAGSAIRGLGADTLADRQLRAAEQTAKNTERLIKTIEENGLAYS